MRHTDFLRRLTMGTLVLCMAVSGYVALQDSSREATAAFRIETPKKTQPKWIIYSPEEVDEGVSVPPNTNILLQLPLGVGGEGGSILREVLFGGKGQSVRYWGYCFPADEEENPAPKLGFPGALFLSEAERQARIVAAAKNKKIFTPFDPPKSKEDLARNSITTTGRIRHEKERFGDGENCYLMTSSVLPIGSDFDSDRLNAQLEKQYKTDPFLPDSDEDGLEDGAEVFTYKTNPNLRDTDGDGLTDGLEVLTNTNPLVSDTDRDGLCDGYCRIGKVGRFCTEFSHTTDCTNDQRGKWGGEDKNLDGEVNDGETDPRVTSTNGDGSSDYQNFLNCLLTEKEDC